ncbi:hypothetical protein LVJ82_17165 [Vitreoscilla massiliensis]|uniref:Uncharacterized protein n=1 Tax=Vitreoscilla massiliensis TaxID=1689272 RepID=A0ABY4E1C4_9NEIS|nr:hypothetical protein [Vitreoscilla massiliensis]UOO89150.1 hypothetical protein LVJ82_17165 [Vitreoscilla massiliensis]
MSAKNYDDAHQKQLLDKNLIGKMVVIRSSKRNEVFKEMLFEVVCINKKVPRYVLLNKDTQMKINCRPAFIYCIVENVEQYYLMLKEQNKFRMAYDDAQQMRLEFNSKYKPQVA